MSLGKARWRDRVILDGRVLGFGRGGRVWSRAKKANLGRQWDEMEDEGKSSCEKLRAVSAVLVVVAVCENTPFRNSNPCKSTENRIFGPPEYIQTPHSVGPPRFGGLPNSRSTTCGGHTLFECLTPHAADPWAPRPGFWFKYGPSGLREGFQATRRAGRIHFG